MTSQCLQGLRFPSGGNNSGVVDLIGAQFIPGTMLRIIAWTTSSAGMATKPEVADHSHDDGRDLRSTSKQQLDIGFGGNRTIGGVFLAVPLGINFSAGLIGPNAL